jgi:hypothetical protein
MTDGLSNGVSEIDSPENSFSLTAKVGGTSNGQVAYFFDACFIMLHLAISASFDRNAAPLGILMVSLWWLHAAGNWNRSFFPFDQQQDQ